RESLVSEFSKFFSSKTNSETYYILKSTRQDRIELLKELLDKNKIIYKSPSKAKSIKAYSYEKDEEVTVKIETEDFIVPQDQAKSMLVKVLFERNTKLSDTLTYDITAWSLPFVYGLEAFVAEGNIELEAYNSKVYSLNKPDETPYAYLLNWTSMKDARFLSTILNHGFKVNYFTKPFKYNGTNFSAGTLIINRVDNEKTKENFIEELLEIGNSMNRNLIPIHSGSAISSIDLGSHKINFLKKPKIAMLAGDGISTLNFGELWYYFEQEINHPIDIINKQTMSNVNLGEYDVLLLASGKYKNLQSEEGFNKIDGWVKKGGNLILIEKAIDGFLGEKKFELKKVEDEEKEDEEPEPVLYSFAENERENLKKYIQGGIIKMEIDNTHP
ncbi:MAG: hypothetical protein KAI29_29100, partial [Cyclobacteriaceae bacterium]|nr:hypothetical protein [Cyclobacteriaceae bacterium]